MSKRPTKYTLNMSNWRCITDYGSCVGCDPYPAQIDSNSWNLRLPRIEDNSANKIGYVLCQHNVPITQTYLIGRFALASSAGTQFLDAKTPSDGVTPATFRFIIMSGLDGTSMSDPNKRWWSNPISATLSAGGPWSFNIPLNADNWSNVNGQRNATAFAALLKAPQYIGITFGAGGDFGHGIVTNNGYATLKGEGIKLL